MRKTTKFSELTSTKFGTAGVLDDKNC